MDTELRIDRDTIRKDVMRKVSDIIRDEEDRQHKLSLRFHRGLLHLLFLNPDQASTFRLRSSELLPRQ